MRTFYNTNILSAENHVNLKVIPILSGECSMDVKWVDEVEDLSVDYLLKTIENGHTFSQKDWLGGYEKLPIIMDKPSSLKGKTPKRDSKKDQRSQLEENPTTNIAEMMKEIDKKILEMLAIEKTTMGNEIVEEVLRVLRERSASNLEAENTKNTCLDTTQKVTEKNFASEDFEVMTGKDVRNDVFGDFGQYYRELVTEHEILKENHEMLKKDYEVLEKSSKHVTEISEVLKMHQQNQTKELETKLERLVKDLEKEKGEKEVLKQEMERMKSKTEKEQKELKKIKDKYGEKEDLKKEMERMKTNSEKGEKELKKMKEKYAKSESEEELKKKIEKIEIGKESLKKKNQELLSGKEKEEKKLKKMKKKYAKLAKNCQSEKAEKEGIIDELENKYVELAEKFLMVEKECSYVKSLYDSEKLTDNVDNAIADLIVNLDDSDAESDAAAKSNKVPQRPVDVKQEQQPNSSKGNHPPSSLSSDEFIIKRGSVKRPRMQ